MDGNTFTYIADAALKLLPYVGMTILITVSSVICALLVGFILTLCQLSRFTLLRKLVVFYINVMRGTPTLILMLLVYYEIPNLLELFGIIVDDEEQLMYAIIALTMNGSAYFSEAMRSAYLAVSHGQLEAGLSVGMKKRDIIKSIIIPQALVIALPNFGNNIISIIKNSSLVYAIGLTDLYQKGQKLANDTFGFRQLEIFIAVTLIYWGICILSETIMELIENRCRYFLPGRDA